MSVHIRIGARVLLVILLIWFGFIARLSQLGGAFYFAKLRLPAFSAPTGKGWSEGGQHPVCNKRLKIINRIRAFEPFRTYVLLGRHFFRRFLAYL
jgi:hypothetical protein